MFFFFVKFDNESWLSECYNMMWLHLLFGETRMRRSFLPLDLKLTMQCLTVVIVFTIAYVL